MISGVAKKPGLQRKQRSVLKQINSLREQMDDLNDYLDLLEARARNHGKPTLTTEQVRKKLGLA